jgi:FKBP-type peptidyl-prolyl cis-trans isomerase
MKHFILIVSASLLALPLFGQEKSPQLKDQKDKVSYSLGLNIVADLSRQKMDINPDQLAAGIKDALAGKLKDLSYSMGMEIGFNLGRHKIEVNPDTLAAGIKDALAGKPKLTEDQIKEAMTQFQKDMQQKAAEENKKLADVNKTEGAKFLEENKKKPGVKTTESGLQYNVIKEGTGPKPKATDTVTVNYRGTLIEGTEFDSSNKHGQPATLPLNGVIKGWTEGLQLMKVGSKYQFFIPSDLAYGEQVQPGGRIPPNATLLFEVELLDIKPPPTPAPPSSAPPQGPQKGGPPAPPKPTPK